MQRRPAVSESWVCTGRLLWKATLRISASVRLCWLASHGRQFFSPTVRFMPFHREFLKSRSIWAAISATLTFTTPYGKRSRMATVHVEPSTHTSSLIRVKVVTADSAADGAFLTPWTDAAASHFLTFVLFVSPSVQARYASTSRVDGLVEASASSS